MNVSIVSGWLPVVAGALTVVVLVVAVVLCVDWNSRRGRVRLARGVVVAGAVTGVSALVIRIWTPVSGDIPVSAYLWGSTAVLAVWVAVTGWHRTATIPAGRPSRRWPRRAAAVGAVVLTVLMTLGAVNRQTDTFPTLGRLISDDPENVVGTPQLQQIRAQVAATGSLPPQGVVITAAIPPTVSHFATLPAYVYLPPVWFARVTPSLPTLVLLPGEPGSAADWSGAGDADNTADAYARTHHGVAPIIVMPDPNGLATDDTECVDSRFGKAETYLVDDVPAFARSRFHASTAPGSLAVGGLSAGGTCSVMLALRHPTVYPTFASFSGFSSPQYEETTRAQTVDTLFGGSMASFDAHDPTYLLAHGQFAGLGGWFEVGDQDTEPVRAARALQPAALRAGIATCLLVRPGGHDFDVWSQALTDSFPWLTWRLGISPEPSHEPARCTSP